MCDGDYEAKLFRRLRSLEEKHLGSKTLFLLYMCCKILFKDTFILIFFFLPLQSTAELRFNVIWTIRQQWLISVILCLLIVVVAASLLLLDSTGMIANKKFLKLSFKILDTLILPFIAVCTIVCTSNANYLIILSSLTTGLGGLFLQVVYSMFNYTDRIIPLNYFEKTYSKPIIYISLVRTLLTVVVAARMVQSECQLSEAEVLSYTTTLVLLAAAKVKHSLFQKEYLFPLAEVINRLSHVLDLVFSLLVLLQLGTGLRELTSNLPSSIAVVTLFAMKAMDSFIRLRQQDMYLSTVEDISDLNSAKLFLECLKNLAERAKKEEVDIILIILRKRHKIVCKDASCVCNSQISIKKFIRWYIENQLHKLMKQIDEPSIFLAVWFFKLVVYESYPSVLSSIQLNPNLKYSLHSRYSVYCLNQKVRNYIDGRNNVIDVVESQSMFKLEDLSQDIERLIFSDVDNRHQIWRYLSKGLCRVSELHSHCEVSLKNLTEVIKISNENERVFNRSKRFALLLVFYFTRVAQVRVGETLTRIIKEMQADVKEKELLSLEQFRKMIFHKKSCVIETLIDTGTMGNITNVSRNIKEIFGFDKEKIRGMSVNRLMPDFMAEEHVHILKNWARTGTWRTIGKLKEIFCVHQEKFCFSALIYLKIYYREGNLYFITNVFKLNQTDYLIMSPSLSVQGLGRKFTEILNKSAKGLSFQLLVQEDCAEIKMIRPGERKHFKMTVLSLKEISSLAEKFLEELSARSDEKQRARLSSKFKQKIMREASQRIMVEFSVKSQRMGDICILVAKLKESQPVSKQKQSNETILQKQSENIPSNHIQDEERPTQVHCESIISQNDRNSFSTQRLLQTIMSGLLDPNIVHKEQLQSTKFSLWTLVLLASVINFGFYAVYYFQLTDMENIIMADGAVSDMTQLTEITYGQLFIIKSAEKNSAEYHNAVQVFTNLRRDVSEKLAFNFKNVMVLVTYFTKESLFSFLFRLSNWTTNTNQVLAVRSYQFYENYFLLSSDALAGIDSAKFSWHMHLMSKNFPEIQVLNEFFLDYYKQYSISICFQLKIAYLLSLGLFLLITIILAMVMNSYFYSRHQKCIESVDLFEIISMNEIELLKNYYQEQRVIVLDKCILQEIEKQQEIIFKPDPREYFGDQNSHDKLTINKVKFIYEESYNYWMLLLTLFVMLNGFNYLSHNIIFQLNAPSISILDTMNQLFRSENLLLESYIELRGAYELDRLGVEGRQPSEKRLNASLLNRLSSLMNQSQVTFNEVAKQLSAMLVSLNSIDPDMIVQTLVDNLCEAVRPALNDFDYASCVKERENGLVDSGLTVMLQYYQRILLIAIHEIGAQMQSNQTNPTHDYFYQHKFILIDRVFFVMFRGFQLIQSQVLNSYSHIVSLELSKYLYTCIGMTLLLVLMMLLWLLSTPWHRKSLARFQGYSLMIPIQILRDNGRLIAFVKRMAK